MSYDPPPVTPSGTAAGDEGDVQYNSSDSFAGKPFQTFGFWSPLMTGNPSSELVLDDDGGTIAVFTGL